MMWGDLHYCVAPLSAAVTLTVLTGCSSTIPLGSAGITQIEPCDRNARSVHHDLIILYTDSAMARRGTTALRAESAAAIEWTNQAYVNSCVALQVRIVASLPSPMQESGSGIVDTQLALRSNRDIATLRDQHHADLVLLVSADDGDGWTGVGSFFYTYREGRLVAVDSYGVVKDSALEGVTVAHELGHMQGLDHDRENASNPVPGRSNYGFQLCGRDGFRDIMSFGCRNGPQPPILQLYSNPRIAYNGHPTGVDAAADPAHAADGARVLSEMAEFIARFREPPSPSSPGDED
jgi:peptidyl-Asp metalloendopeptidase